MFIFRKETSEFLGCLSHCIFCSMRGSLIASSRPGGQIWNGTGMLSSHVHFTLHSPKGSRIFLDSRMSTTFSSTNHTSRHIKSTCSATVKQELAGFGLFAMCFPVLQCASRFTTPPFFGSFWLVVFLETTGAETFGRKKICRCLEFDPKRSPLVKSNVSNMRKALQHPGENNQPTNQPNKETKQTTTRLYTG